MNNTGSEADTLCDTHNSTSTSTDLVTDHKVIMRMICDVLEEVQFKGPKKIMLNRLADVRNKCHRKYFARILFRAMLIAFNPKETTKYVKNVLDFFYIAVKTLNESDEGGGDDFEPLIQLLLRCCVKNNSDSRTSVRVNIIIVCVKLLDALPNLKTLEQKLQTKIKTMLLQSVRDKVAQIRSSSASALKHFQLVDGVDSCEVTEALMFHLRCDPHVEVRNAVLQALNVNHRTLEFLVGRISDVSEQIRISAFVNIAKNVSMEMINSETIEYILLTGLTDQSAKVQSQATFVVEAWLAFYKNEITTFLSKLEVVTHEKAAYLALNHIFKETNTKFFEKVDMSLWQNDKLISVEKLDVSLAFYWKVIICKFSKVPYCAALLVPTVHDICTYLLKYFEAYEAKYGNDPDGHGPFILLQLLEILLVASRSMEEGGRREIVDFIRLAFDFDFLGAIHVKPLMELFYRVHDEHAETLFFELIQNMLESRSESQDSQEASLPATLSLPSEDEIRAMKIEIANLIHERHKLTCEKEAAIVKNDFLKAHEVETQINKLAADVEVIRVKMTDPGNSNESENESMQSESIKKLQKPSEFISADLHIAFVAFFEYLQRQNTISNSARAFYETIVTKSIMCTLDVVRQYVIKCMCFIGLRDELDAKKSMLICIQAFMYDDESIQAVAYRCMFDLILEYGFDVFDDRKIQKVVDENLEPLNLSSSLLDEQGPSLKMLLLERLNSEDLEIVDIAVQGVIKLFLGNRLCSSRCTVKLLLLWINPVLAGSELEKVIGTWLPEFSKMGTQQAMAVAEALVPALRKICNAGNNSPLVDASPEKLCAFVSFCTSSESLRKFVHAPENVHGRLVNSLLDAMPNLGGSVALSAFGKALKFFSVRGMNDKSLQVLLGRVTRTLKSSNNKVLNQSLNAFLKYLNAELLFVGDKQEIPDEAYDTAISESDESLNILDDSEEENDRVKENDKEKENYTEKEHDGEEENDEEEPRDFGMEDF